MADQSYDEFNNSSFTHVEKCNAGMLHGARDGIEEEIRAKMFEAEEKRKQHEKELAEMQRAERERREMEESAMRERQRREEERKRKEEEAERRRISEEFDRFAKSRLKK